LSSSFSGRFGVRVSSLEYLAEFCEAARDPAGDRAGGDLERFADRLIALVAREEAVEDLLAGLRQLGERLADGERFVEAVERLVGVLGLDVLAAQLLARAGADAVDREPPCELGDPGADCLVVP